MRRNQIFLICLLCLLSKFAFALDKATSKRYAAKINHAFSFIGLGTVELGRDWGMDINKSVHPSESQTAAVLKAALSAGINVVDTATSYQLSEERIGHYIPQTQYNYFLITKPGEHNIRAQDPRCEKPSYDHIYCRKPGAEYDFSYAAIIKDVTQSLEYLHVNTLDLVLLHLDSKDAQAVLEKGDAIQALKDLRAQHKLKYIGVSINGPAALYAVKNLDIDAIELEYNLLNQQNAQAMRIAHEKGMAVIVRGGLGTGLLTPFAAKHIDDPKLPFAHQIKALLKLVNHDYDQLLALELAFLYQNPNITSVIIGADQADFIAKDAKLLNAFDNDALIEQAKLIVSKFPQPKDFTEIMGEFYNDEK